ncbi:hypothetical protein [Mycobacteroides franklinii]|uniref:hypothetical protein n=1 Tax=Mycobacteroides franklinii TaxID=948102 RepID=UPI0009927521|nr:hypothetical protein [Mycobacteroides franklinii]
MGNLLLRPLRLWVMYLPQLAACYLLGLLGRTVAIALAAKLGAHGELWADLILPFAGFARLASFVAMFVVIRDAIPSLQRIPRTSTKTVDLFSNIVVPFFAIYIGWQMLRDDLVSYGEASLYYKSGSRALDTVVELTPDNIPVSDSAWVLIVSAFLLQFVLKWQQNRTPKWFVAIRLYLQVFWVFLTLTFAASRGASIILKPSKWLSERRLVVWFNETKEHLIAEYTPFRIGWAAVSAIWRLVWDVAAMPLLWLVIAGLVYGIAAGATWRGVVHRVAGERGAAIFARATPAQTRLQEELQRRLALAEPTVLEKVWAWIKKQTLAQFGKYGSILESARPILHAGLLPLVGYIFGFVALAWLSLDDSFYRLQIESGYLTRGFAWIIGEHDSLFWRGPGDLVFLLAITLVTTLRICLVASTYAYCVETIEAERDAQAELELSGLEAAASTTPHAP